MTRAPADADALRDGAAALGLRLADEQLQRLLQYLALIERWNRVYNLTAIRDADQMLTQHLLDSLAVVGPLTRWTDGAATRLLDVGSGAGLPGVPIAILCPEIAVSSVDTVAKKASFQRQVALELGLGNFTAHHTRVEALAPDGGWPVITSRAFASLADFVALTAHALAPGGVWMAMKGQVPTQEIADLPASVDMFHVEPLRVPGLDAERCIVWMRRRA